MKKTAYSYIRFSSPEQALGRSQARQLEAFESYCAEQGLVPALDGQFLDAGVSGWKGDHLGEKGQLARFISLVKDGTIAPGSVLVVESLDRLSREQVTKALPTFLDLLELGIEIVTLADRKIYRKGVSDFDVILSIFIMSRAHEESATKSKRIRDAFSKKHQLAREKGKPMGNARPLWLDLTDDGQKYLLNPERTAIVQRIYQLAVDGYGKATIARVLNIDGVPSFKGTTWGGSSVDKVLSNRAVIGEYQPYSIQVDGSGVRQKSGEPIIGYFPAAISESIFYQAQAAVDSRKISRSTKQTAKFNIWQGIAKCTICHSAMHLVNKGKPPKGYTYLQCYRHKKGLCNNSLTRIESAEIVFKHLLTLLDSKSLIQDESKHISKELLVVEGRLREKKVLLEKYKSLVAEAPTRSMNEILLRTEMEENELERKKVLLQTALAEEKTISKKDFLKKLDLISYEGRYKANMLLKKIGVLSYIGKGYIITQNVQKKLSEMQLSASSASNNREEQAIYALAYHDGKVGTMPIEEEGKYPGGFDHVAANLLARMTKDNSFVSTDNYRET